ncbi:MAG: hypothetical protein PHQ53_10255 [Candidatus Krumholzibacteria bacterium]|nr:hypothetical protein [Candidatus Krumholzibacteria bacterium]
MCNTRPSRRHPAGGDRFGCALLAVVFCAGAAAAALQPPADGLLTEREFFLLDADQRPLVLAHGAIDPAHFVLRVAGQPWQLDRDFRLRSRSGEVVPLRDWTQSGRVVAVVEYRFQPGLLQSSVGWRPLAPPPPTASRDAAQPAPTPAASIGPGYGDLDVRGSKAVYVSSGSRRDLAVDQNLRLNITGQLTRDIYVRATLSDDNLPVVPEGNTEQLQDIDQVLVELLAPTWQATLGDFVAQRGGTRFGGYRRKLQGFTLTALPGAARVEALFGSPRGRYRTVELRGQEANQGPYFLGTGAVGQNLFIVAGSERVVMDGQELTRGADRDYVIDYVRGTITLTYRRLVTAETLIAVEFEEGEGSYARSVVGAGGGARGELGGVPVAASVRLTREADDPGRLRSGELSAEDEAVLAASGDDPLAAVGPAAVQVEPGEGSYVRREVGGETYFEFNETNGDWRVEFFYAGRGLGDYTQTRLTEIGVRVFTYVGMGQGGYRVGRQLPLPAAQSLATVTVAVGDSIGTGLHAEWHASSLDRNRLSTLDDQDNDGQAAHVAARSGPVGLAGGDLTAAAAWQWRDDRFAPFLTTKTAQDYEGWGIGERARREGFLADKDAEVTAQVDWRIAAPRTSLQVGADVGRLDHGRDLTAERFGGDTRWQWRGGAGAHRWRQARSRDERDPLDVLRQDQGHDLSWRVGPLVPRGGWSRQFWFDDAITGTGARGWQMEVVTAGLAAGPDNAWRWDLQFSRGLVDSLRGAVWTRARDSRTWQGSTSTPRFAGLRAVADGTIRQVKLPNGQTETTRLGRLELGANWPQLGSDWNLGYSVDNSRAEVLARRIAYVGENQGRYDEGGNFVGDGQGDYELLLAGTDSLVVTTGVQANLNWRQSFAWLGEDRFWGAWTSETRLGVEARSRRDAVGPLLRLAPSAIFDPQWTVLGRVDLTEEITLLRHLRAWDLRWRFDYAETMDRQYAQGRLDRLRREHTVTATWNPLATASLQVRAVQEDDRRRTDDELNPTQLDYTTVSRRFEGEGSWRPQPGGRLALALERRTRDDRVSLVSQRELALRPSVRWRLARNVSTQAEIRIANVTSDEPAGSRRPYFFSLPGTNVEASNRLGWDPNRNLTVSLAWFARKPGERKWQHDLRLESTARF